MSIAQDTKRKFQIIYAIASTPKPNLAYLSERTEIPEPSLKRQIGAIRKEYAMKIEFVRDKARGASGHYMILDWGIIDRDEFFRSYYSIIND